MCSERALMRRFWNWATPIVALRPPRLVNGQWVLPAIYHSPDLPTEPTHYYGAGCNSWLRDDCGWHALVQRGDHGTWSCCLVRVLELSEDCCFPTRSLVIFRCSIRSSSMIRVRGLSQETRPHAVIVDHLSRRLLRRTTYGVLAKLGELVD